MNAFSARALYWAPRALSIAFLAFLSLFALDVFEEGLGFWPTLLALVMHLMPVFVLGGVLALAWRWEWIGAAVLGAAGCLYIYWAAGRPIAPAMKLVWMLTIAGPAWLIAALFLFNWRRRRG
jgi:hypothetical protein